MPKYLNAIKDKKCSNCGNWFKGDESVQGEICKNCSEEKRKDENETDN